MAFEDSDGTSYTPPTSGGDTDNTGGMTGSAGGYQGGGMDRGAPTQPDQNDQQPLSQDQTPQGNVDWSYLKKLYHDLLADHGAGQQPEQGYSDMATGYQSPNTPPKTPTGDRDTDMGPARAGGKAGEDQYRKGVYEQLGLKDPNTSTFTSDAEKKAQEQAAIPRNMAEAGKSSWLDLAGDAVKKAMPFQGKRDLNPFTSPDATQGPAGKWIGEQVGKARKTLEDFVSGADAMTPEEYKKAIQKQREIEAVQAGVINAPTSTETNGAAVQRIAQEQGDETAKKAIHAAGHSSDGLRYQASAALNSGRLDDAEKLLNEAFSHQLDGKHVTWVQGAHGFTAIVQDLTTGKSNSYQFTIPQVNEITQSHVFDANHAMHMGIENLFAGMTQSRGMDIRASNAEKVKNWGMKEPTLPTGVQPSGPTAPDTRFTQGGWATDVRGYGAGSPPTRPPTQANQATRADMDFLRQQQEQFAGYRPTSKGLIGSQAPEHPLPSDAGGHVDSNVAIPERQEDVDARTQSARGNINKAASVERQIRGVPAPTEEPASEPFKNRPDGGYSTTTRGPTEGPSGGGGKRGGGKATRSLASIEYQRQRQADDRAQGQAEAAANRPSRGPIRNRRKRHFEEGGPVTLDGQSYQKIDGVWHRQ